MIPHQHAPEFSAVIVGGGSGNRFGNSDKILTPLAGQSLLWYSLNVFARHPGCIEIVVVLSHTTQARGRDIANSVKHSHISVVPGGETRRKSVLAGLAAIRADCEFVAIHDAARPLLSGNLLNELLACAASHGASVPATPVSDTIHVVNEEQLIVQTLERGSLRAAQTPQIARRAWFDSALADGREATDEAASLTEAGYPVVTVPGDPDNLKITWPEDIERAEAILSRRLQHT